MTKSRIPLQRVISV